MLPVFPNLIHLIFINIDQVFLESRVLTTVCRHSSQCLWELVWSWWLCLSTPSGHRQDSFHLERGTKDPRSPWAHIYPAVPQETEWGEWGAGKIRDPRWGHQPWNRPCGIVCSMRDTTGEAPAIDTESHRVRKGKYNAELTIFQLGLVFVRSMYAASPHYNNT